MISGEKNVAGYIATGDFQRYLAGKPPWEIPYSQADSLRSRLDDPVIRGILPYDICAPLELNPTGQKGVATEPFVNGGWDPACGSPPAQFLSAIGSYTGPGDARTGVFHASFQTRLPYLMFVFAGYPGEQNLSFTLRNAAGGNQHGVKFNSAVGETWAAKFVPAPGQETEITATDDSTNHWFAFTAPVPVGRLSYYGLFFLTNGKWIFWIGISGLVLTACSNWLERIPAEGEEIYKRLA